MDTRENIENRFDNDASRYAAYLESPDGRLRSELTFANLQDFLPSRENRTLTALDLGCGTGATAVRLAQLGIDVTLLDSSSTMLEIAELAAVEAGVRDKVTIKQIDVAQLSKIFQTRSFDVILCHNVLEFVDDPVEVLRGAMLLMRDSSAILSVLVRNQAGEVLKAALLSGDLVAAENSLSAEWGDESLYGGQVRLFARDKLLTILKAASLEMIAERGVRVASDYLPPQVSRTEEYPRIFELERKLGNRPEFSAIARYTHCLARRSEPT